MHTSQWVFPDTPRLIVNGSRYPHNCMCYPDEDWMAMCVSVPFPLCIFRVCVVWNTEHGVWPLRTCIVLILLRLLCGYCSCVQSLRREEGISLFLKLRVFPVKEVFALVRSITRTEEEESKAWDLTKQSASPPRATLKHSLGAETTTHSCLPELQKAWCHSFEWAYIKLFSHSASYSGIGIFRGHSLNGLWQQMFS